MKKNIGKNDMDKLNDSQISLQVHVPTVSVCIPAYCGAHYLGHAIESVLAQSLTDFELLIIDDCSPDDTADVVNRYQDSRIRFLRNPTNLGAQGNWNRCLEESRGCYFKLLPQDDLLAPECLQQQVTVLEQDVKQRIALVFCLRSIISPQGQAIMNRGYFRAREGLVNRINLLRQCLRYGTNLIGEPGSVIVRRHLCQRVGPFDASLPYVVDLDYWFRLLLQGDAYYLPSALASFRISQGSWSVALGARQSQDFSHFIAKVSKNPDFQISRWDILAGNIMARLNCYLRALLYRFVLGKN